MEIKSFGDSRAFIIDVMVGLRDGNIDVNRGMDLAACMKVLNDNVQVEINAAKVAMKARELGHDFGRVARMGEGSITKMIE